MAFPISLAAHVRKLARERPRDPAFIVDDRVLALLGYEIVEGKVDPGTSAIRETRRVSFLPRPP